MNQTLNGLEIEQCSIAMYNPQKYESQQALNTLNRNCHWTLPMLYPSEPREHQCPSSLSSYPSQQVSEGETNWSGRSAKTHFSEGNITQTGKRFGGSCKTVQICAGQDGGCDAAVHVMRIIFQDANTEGCLLVDAFNTLKRKAALHNISILCPPLSPILINTYRTSTMVKTT